MDAANLPVTGIGAVNARGEGAVFIDSVDGGPPDGLRIDANRIAVMREGKVLSVRGYGELTVAALSRRRRGVVVELRGDEAVRATEIKVDA